MSRIAGFALFFCLSLAWPDAARAQTPSAEEAAHAAHAAHATQSDAPAKPTPAPAPKRTAPWTKRTLEIAEALPVQDGGRIKPLSTYAGFTLLRLNGKRSVTTPADEKLTPTEWLLDTLFFPEQAFDYPVFVVQNIEAVEAVGVDLADKKKRDHYSFNELRPGMAKLLDLAHQYTAIEEKNRTPVQSQIVNLSENVMTFWRLSQHLDFAHARIPADVDPAVARVFAGRKEVRFSELVAKAGEFPHGTEMGSRVEALAENMSSATNTLVLLPPTDDRAEWLTPSSVLMEAVRGKAAPQAHLDLLTSFETLDDVRTDPAKFEAEMVRFGERAHVLTLARGEDSKIALEVRYYALQPLMWSLALFILAFLFVAVLWLKPTSRALYVLSWSSAGVATAFVVFAIVLRCIIRDRPPVSTLYETVLFVTGVGAIVALATEWIQRQRIALSAAVIVGLVGIFIANGYETLDKKDTMPSLIAVLDTNFWLATHVTSVTVGYSAGMLAALLGSLYILAKVVGFKRSEPAFYKSLGRMVYGVLCFGVIFATIGTILGGIWANDSWGRFWGWDPKENGALLIVISMLAILHARMGGFLRELGVSMAAAFTGTVVAFSWWGVNLLGVGLHSYGFTSGIAKVLWIYYGIQWGIVLLGGYVWIRERALARATIPSAVDLDTAKTRGERSSPSQPEAQPGT